MKVGIITWFKTPNFGTNLQCIALYKYLVSLGIKAEIVNFSQPKYNTKKESLFNKIKRQPRKILNKIVNRKWDNKISNKLKKIIFSMDQLCKFSKEIHNDQEYVEICNQYDLLIFGSDQIWNPMWFHPYYFGFYQTLKTKKISYAASTGTLNFDQNSCYLFKKYLYNFDAISLRESKAATILSNITGKECQCVVDPVFLLSKDDWINLFSIKARKEKYILVMFLTDNQKHWKAVEKLSQKNKCKIKVIPYDVFSYFRKNEKYIDISLLDFLDLIFNASIIITDSFHVCAFSLIFEKEFYVFERFPSKESFSQNARIYNLTSMVNLYSRVLRYESGEILTQEPLNYDNIHKLLELKITQSKDYLRENICNLK